MTREFSLRSIDIPTVQRFAVGFDNMFDDLLRGTSQQNNNYPPYNLLKKSDNEFIIELAVAGFSEGEIDITVENNTLVIRGDHPDTRDTHEFLHRGISGRNFVRSFTLADHVEVMAARIVNGILAINLQRIIPEEKLPKKIAIAVDK